MIIHLLFRVFLLFEMCLEISLVNCQHKNTTKITTKETTRTRTLSIPANCNYTECGAKSEQYCLCPEFKHRNHSSNWPVPNIDTCPSIGCSLFSKYCSCMLPEPYYIPQCVCDENKCNKTECAGRSSYIGCYCYFGDKAIRTYEMPVSRNCSDLLKEIEHQNGRYQCSAFSCKCDSEYGDCICKPPRNKNLQTPKPKQCNYENCNKLSFELCKCVN